MESCFVKERWNWEFDDAHFFPAVFIRTSTPLLVKFMITVLVLLLLGNLYHASRIEKELLRKLASLRPATLRNQTRNLRRDKRAYFALIAIVVRFWFWSIDFAVEERYGRFPCPMIFRREIPIPSKDCFNGTSADLRNFHMFEASNCSQSWQAPNGFTAVQYVPAIYHEESGQYSCLPPSNRILYGKLTVDNDDYSGPSDAYEHDLAALHQSCAENNMDCSSITKVRTSSDGHTYIMTSSPKRRVNLFLVRRRTGLTVLREVFYAMEQGKGEVEALRLGLSIHSQLQQAICFDKQRVVPIGKKDGHLRIDTRLLVCLVFLECVLYFLRPMRRDAENEIELDVPEVACELLDVA